MSYEERVGGIAALTPRPTAMSEACHRAGNSSPAYWAWGNSASTISGGERREEGEATYGIT